MRPPVFGKISELYLKYKIIAKTIIAIVILTIVALIVNVIYGAISAALNPASVFSTSSLEKIVAVSNLSTYQASYNGIAQIQNAKNPNKIDYYVSYEAKVSAGIDFDQIKISVDDKEKIFTVELPEVKLMTPEVDISSLDYIFVDSNANTQTVSQQAYKACIADVNRECSEDDGIKTLAYQNAKNTIEALVEPFIRQGKPDYQLVIE